MPWYPLIAHIRFADLSQFSLCVERGIPQELHSPIMVFRQTDSFGGHYTSGQQKDGTTGYDVFGSDTPVSGFKNRIQNR